MNKKFLAIIISIAVIIVLFSFVTKKIVPKKSENILRKTEQSTRETLLNMAAQYETKGDYLKAKEALKEYTRSRAKAGEDKGIQKRIEELNIKILFSGIITSDSARYEIKKGDTLGKIASKFNTTVELIKKQNNLKNDIIMPGRFLKVENTTFKIIVNKTDNTLTLMKQDGEAIKTYKVSTGENFSTPRGVFKIEEKMQRPVWYKIGAVVDPASPEYELGSRWMGLSVSGYGIHGTKDNSTIGRHITKGCVRMKNADVEELYAIVPSGAEVTIVE